MFEIKHEVVHSDALLASEPSVTGKAIKPMVHGRHATPTFSEDGLGGKAAKERGAAEYPVVGWQRRRQSDVRDEIGRMARR